MRILITGGCGFLGSHLVEHFLKTTPYEIVVLDKLTYASNGFDRLRDIDVVSNSRTGSLSAVRDSGRQRVLGCDLSQPIPAGVIQEVGAVDYIIHAAAESHVDNSITDPLPFLMSNVIGTHHLLFSNMVHGCRIPRRIFIVSTDEVYGPAPWDHDGFDEASAFRPANPYAASKAGAECLAFAYANTYKLPITIVNTMNLIGERQHPEKFVPLVIRKVLAGEKVSIHADQTKTRSGTRFYLHCRTFANALAWMIKSHDDYWEMSGGKQRPDLPDKIHVCGEREMSNLDLAQAIAGFIGKPLNYELVDFHSSRPGHDLRYAMDDSLIRQLGWQRPMGIMDSLKKTVEWYLSNRRWLGGTSRRLSPEPVREPEMKENNLARGDAKVSYDQVVRVDSPPRRPPVVPMTSEKRQNLDDAGWKVGDAEEFLDDIEIGDLPEIGDFAKVGTLPRLDEENRKFESYVEPLIRQPLDPENDEHQSLFSYRAGIFADPLGADFERDIERQEVDDRLIDVGESLLNAKKRIAALEADRDAAKLVVGAVVEVTDGPARGCLGRIKGTLRQGVLITVGITWAPDPETAKYIELAMTFVADQLRPVL